MGVLIWLRMGVMVCQLDQVFHPFELVVHIVPLMSILVDVIPRVPRGAVVMQREGVPQMMV